MFKQLGKIIFKNKLSLTRKRLDSLAGLGDEPKRQNHHKQCQNFCDLPSRKKLKEQEINIFDNIKRILERACSESHQVWFAWAYYSVSTRIDAIIDVNDISASYVRLCQAFRDSLKFIFDKCFTGKKKMKKLKQYCASIQKLIKKGTWFIFEIFSYLLYQ